MAERPKIIVDTGPLVGFFDKSDQWHRWSVGQFGELPSPMITCEAVLSEASYLLEGRTGPLFEMLDLGALEIVQLFPAQGARIRALMGAYAPRMQLADACLVRLSEMRPASHVLTTDATDFGIYRRNRTERIPLIVPP